jgi:hypothetical protein
MPPPHRSERSAAAEQVSIIDSLSELPFPEKEGRSVTDGQWGGPGFRLAVLRESRDFWEDRSTEIVEAAERELESDLTALTVILSGRWGAPEEIDLRPYLGLDDTGSEAKDSEPLGFLCGVAGSVQVWRMPHSQRWIGLAIGQTDPEWPLQLLAAIGDVSLLGR